MGVIALVDLEHFHLESEVPLTDESGGSPIDVLLVQEIRVPE
jgi:hypothetical protein